MALVVAGIVIGILASVAMTRLLAKLLFGVGLIVGTQRLIATVIVGALAAAIGIVILLALRRITLKSYVPYGPFLIIGAIWAITVSRGI